MTTTRLVSALSVALLSSGVSHADVLHVPGTFSTVQAALDSSAEGDQVVVAPGNYLENLTFPPRAVHLVSAAGPELTVIDGGQLGSVVHFVAGCPAGAIVEGFTLTGGKAAYGGGISCALSAEPTIRGNHVVHNEATYDAGGIFPRPENRVTIERNLIGWNTAVGFAGGLQAPASDSVVRNNIFVENAAAHGGAYFARVESSVLLENCTFFGNQAPNGSVAAGDGGLQLSSCVFDGHAGAPFSMFGGGAVSVEYSTVPGGAGAPWFGAGCVDANPRLADPLGGDFRLRPTSPALDAGRPGPDHQDLDGTTNDQGHDGGPAGNERVSAWYPAPSLPEPRWAAAAVASGGRIWCLTGQTASGRTRSVLSYDAESDAWVQHEDYPGPELRSANAVVLDGYVYLLGGYLYDYAVSDRLWRLEPGQLEWTERTPLPEPRMSFTAAAVSGQLYVLGGRSQPAWQYHDTALVFDPSLEGGAAGSPWRERCPADFATPLGDNIGASFEGELFTFGSYEPAAWDRVLHYSPGSGSWRELRSSSLTTKSAVVRLGRRLFALEGEGGRFWSWDPTEVLPREACAPPSSSPQHLPAGPVGGADLNFVPQPAMPGPSGASGLVVMDGLVYAVGGVWPMSAECWVFQSRPGESP